MTIDPKRYFAPMPLRLPVSGYNVLVRRISNLTLLASGGFPADLSALVWKISQANDGENVVGDVLKSDPEALSRIAQLIDRIVPHALVSPKAGTVTDVTLGEVAIAGFEEKITVLQGTIALVDLSDPDKNAIFLHAQGIGGPVTDLAPFRDDGERAASGPGGEAVQPAAVEPDRVAAGEPVGA